MPEILASVKDASVSISNTNFSTARDATNGASFQNTAATDAQAIRCAKTSFRGSDTFFVARSFFEFDTSGISATPSAATLKLYGQTNTSADFFVVKSTVADGATIQFAEFDSIDGWSAGADNSSNVTKYSNEVTSFSTGQYNNITLNSTALSDMANNDTLKICLIEADFDLTNTAPSDTTARATGMSFANDGEGNIRDPKIDYTEGTAGYGHEVISVAAGSIGKVKSVATANIGKINTVD